MVNAPGPYGKHVAIKDFCSYSSQVVNSWPQSQIGQVSEDSGTIAVFLKGAITYRLSLDDKEFLLYHLFHVCALYLLDPFIFSLFYLV